MGETRENFPVQKMLDFLEAGKGIFVDTWFTGNRKIFPNDAPPGLDDAFGMTIDDWRANMESHFEFFKNWRQWVNDQPGLKARERNKMFLKLEQVIVLKNSIFGFLQLCEYILERNPDAYICPQRCTSNRIELYFGNIKAGAKTVSSEVFRWRAAILRLRKDLKEINGNCAGLAS